MPVTLSDIKVVQRNRQLFFHGNIPLRRDLYVRVSVYRLHYRSKITSERVVLERNPRPVVFLIVRGLARPPIVRYRSFAYWPSLFERFIYVNAGNFRRSRPSFPTRRFDIGEYNARFQRRVPSAPHRRRSLLVRFELSERKSLSRTFATR